MNTMMNMSYNINTYNVIIATHRGVAIIYYDIYIKECHAILKQGISAENRHTLSLQL